jgi:hypothetical protein
MVMVFKQFFSLSSFFQLSGIVFHYLLRDRIELRFSVFVAGAKGFYTIGGNPKNGVEDTRLDEWICRLYTVGELFVIFVGNRRTITQLPQFFSNSNPTLTKKKRKFSSNTV